MAAPHAAGGAALYLADHPSATPAQVKAALTTAASIGKISSVRGDTPNRLLHTGTGAPEPPDNPGDPDPEPEPDRPWWCTWMPWFC